MAKFDVAHILLAEARVVAAHHLVPCDLAVYLVLAKREPLAGMEVLPHVHLGHVAHVGASLYAAQHQPPVLAGRHLAETLSAVEQVAPEHIDGRWAYRR